MFNYQRDPEGNSKGKHLKPSSKQWDLLGTLFGQDLYFPDGSTQRTFDHWFSPNSAGFSATQSTTLPNQFKMRPFRKRNRDKLMHTTHLVHFCFFLGGWNMMEQLVDLSLLKSGCLHGWCVDESPAASSHTDLFQSTLWRSRATCLVDESGWVMCSVSIQKKPSLRIIDIL